MAKSEARNLKSETDPNDEKTKNPKPPQRDVVSAI
jgi:hypothetical protein